MTESKQVSNLCLPCQFSDLLWPDSFYLPFLPFDMGIFSPCLYTLGFHNLFSAFPEFQAKNFP